MIARLNGFTLLGAIWVLILGGLFFARRLPEPHDLVVWAFSIHIPYLGYPLLVAFSLSSSHSNRLAFVAAVAFLAFIPIAASFQDAPTLPWWFAPATAFIAAGWLFVLWQGAWALVRAEFAPGFWPTAKSAALFLFLAWGGAVPLQGRVRSALRRRPAA